MRIAVALSLAMSAAALFVAGVAYRYCEPPRPQV